MKNVKRTQEGSTPNGEHDPDWEERLINLEQDMADDIQSVIRKIFRAEEAIRQFDNYKRGEDEAFKEN